jgi:hypothetical protein
MKAICLVWFVLGPALRLDTSPAFAQNRQAAMAALSPSGVHCGLLVECTRFDQLGLHFSAGAALQTGPLP